MDLTITDQNVNVIGMFAYAQDAQIYNVTLRNPDITGAFTPGNTIAPVLAFRKNCSTYDNHIINPVERQGNDNVQAISSEQMAKTGGNGSRTESLIRIFKEYAPYGVTYDPDQDSLFYHGEQVKLFVVFSPYKEADMTYAFELCYHDRNANSALYLEAVRAPDGAIDTIRPLDEGIAKDLLEGLSTDGGADGEDGLDKPPKSKDNTINAVTMNASQIWDRYGMVATDLIPDDLEERIWEWMAQCADPGVYLLRTGVPGAYTTYLYYSGGGHCPWYQSVSDGENTVNLYPENHMATTEGFTLITITAPQDYADISVYVEGTEVAITQVKDIR